MSYKECSRCQTQKPVSAFTKAAAEPGGLSRWCRECVRTRRQERIAAETSEQRERRLQLNRDGKRGRRTGEQVVCACCGSEFSRRDGRSIYCSVVCKRRGSPERQERILTYARQRHAGNRDWIADYKISRGCIDCGYNSHSEALQFDHEGTKNFEMAKLRWSIEKTLQEIERGECVVRCANCHAVKTNERRAQ